MKKDPAAQESERASSAPKGVKGLRACDGWACCNETPCQWGDHPCDRKSVNAEAAIRVVHVLRTAGPKCPKCGQGLESEGGSVVRAGSWDWGPLYWRCEDDGEEWGHT